MDRRYGLPRSLRLRTRRDYLAIQRTGRTVRGQHFVLLVAEGAGRLGITVSKKVGNAVTRNRVKRLIREVVRRARDDREAWVPAGRDVVVVARASAAGLGYPQVERELLRQREGVAAC